jgi:hypothetical protein
MKTKPTGHEFSITGIDGASLELSFPSPLGALKFRRCFPYRSLMLMVSLLLSTFPSMSATFPFSPQERLEYVVKWDPPGWMFFLPEITAGNLFFRVVARTEDQDGIGHRFEGSAVSTSSIMKVNDFFRSTSRGDDLCAGQMLKITHEGKRHREIEVSVRREQNAAMVVEKDISLTPPKTLRTETVTNFPVCPSDLLGAIYRARMLPMQTGGVYHFMLTDNGRSKEVTLRSLQRENVRSPAGAFSTQKVEVSSFFGGLFKQRGLFYIWFTDDARRLPVKFEMKVKLGKVCGSLVKLQE